MIKTNTNYNGQEYWVLRCMYQDFKDLLSTHMRIILSGRGTPEINLLEERIIALEETMTPEIVNFEMRQSHLPKEMRLSNVDRSQLYNLKTKMPNLFKDLKIQNIRSFFIEILNRKSNVDGSPRENVVVRELTMDDHYDLHTMMKLKDDEVN
jgi:hypothetical protein